MKNRAIINIITILFFFIFNEGMVYSSESQVLKRVMTQLSCNNDEAANFMIELEFFIKQAQDNISKVASQPGKNKIFIKNYTRSNFFLSSSSVQVHIFNKFKEVETLNVDVYLSRLARLSKYRYTSVELLFNPDYLALGNIYPIDNINNVQQYELSVSMWQLYKENNFIYSDATLQNIIIVFYKKNSKFDFKIKNIAVKETISIEEFHEKMKQW